MEIQEGLVAGVGEREKLYVEGWAGGGRGMAAEAANET